MREKILKQIIIGDNIIYDPTTVDWMTFNWESGYINHIISDVDIYKFYLVSEKYYNTSHYEDILLLLNKIDNIFDVFPGITIRIPKQIDIDTFIKNNIQV
jgi:hypothetical protein